MSNDFDNLAPPTVETRVVPSTATLGDVLTLSIRVSHPQALSVEAPLLSKTAGSFEVRASTRLPTELSGGSAVELFQASLQNFTTGPQLVPALEIPYRDPLGKSHSVKTQEQTVTIQEVPSGPQDKGDIRGIKGVIGPTAWSPWWWLLVAVLLSVLGLLLWRKRKLALAGPPPPPPVPADVQAMEKLQRLEQTDWLATGKIKEYYSAVSDILRDYLEKGFQTMALERTTGELMRDLRKKSDITMDQQASLRTLLEDCDLVKFAKFRPDPSEAKGVHATAVKFVEETRVILRKDDEEFVPQ